MAGSRWSLLTSFACGLALLCALAGCKHDLDKLSANHDKLRAGSGGGSSGRGGSSGKGGSGAGRGGSAGDAGIGGSGGSKADAGLNCEPCEPLPEPAKNLGLRTCCRGVLGDECGLTYGEGTLCLPRMVPAQDNAECGDLQVGGMELMGCCRPDGRCGVVADRIGLGCIAREEIAPVLSPGATPPAPKACEYTCAEDEDCDGPIRDLQCAVTLDQTKHYCAQVCGRDGDCANRPGTLCSLTVDFRMKRVQAICTKPVGSAEPGDPCSRTDDCAHNVCGRLPGKNFCSQLCKGANDCRAGYKDCALSDYGTVGDGGAPQKFYVCQPPP